MYNEFVTDCVGANTVKSVAERVFYNSFLDKNIMIHSQYYLIDEYYVIVYWRYVYYIMIIFVDFTRLRSSGSCVGYMEFLSIILQTSIYYYLFTKFVCCVFSYAHALIPFGLAEITS